MRLDIHYYLYPLLIFPTYYKILHLHYLPPTKEEVYVFSHVCLSVCYQDYSKTRAWIWVKVASREMLHGRTD